MGSSRDASSINADFQSLAPLAGRAGCDFLFAKGNNQGEMRDWISDRRPDVIFCFGWSYLLGKEMLEDAPLGVIGYHPTALPKNRGRHPIIWALALGLAENWVDLLFHGRGADSGDILSQSINLHRWQRRRRRPLRESDFEHSGRFPNSRRCWPKETSNGFRRMAGRRPTGEAHEQGWRDRLANVREERLQSRACTS